MLWLYHMVLIVLAFWRTPTIIQRRLLLFIFKKFLSVCLYGILTSICCLFLDGSHSDEENLKSQYSFDFNAHVIITLKMFLKYFPTDYFTHMIPTKSMFRYYSPKWTILPVLHIYSDSESTNPVNIRLNIFIQKHSILNTIFCINILNKMLGQVFIIIDIVFYIINSPEMTKL